MRPTRDRRGLVVAVLLGVGAARCGGASPETGITAYLRTSTGQFVPGTMPPSSGAADPAVRGVNLVNSKIYPGLQNLSLSGSVEQGVSTLVGLDGDVGYWVVQAPLPDPQTAGSYEFQTKLTFSPSLPLGQQKLVLRGVDRDGVIGPGLELPLMVAAAPPPVGALVFTLTWATNADLDLHVVIPNTADPSMPIEIWNRAPVGLPVLGPADPPYDDATIKSAPQLDFDSNAGCVIDGVRREDVIFALPPADNSFVPIAPPPGEYIVRVDAFSMCGQTAAQWRVDVTMGPNNDTVVNPATWEATDTDTRGDHGAGAGRLALDFQL